MTDVVDLIEKKMANKPVIRVVQGELVEIIEQAERAILDAGLEVYQRGAFLVRPVVEEVDAADGRKTWVAQLFQLEPRYLRGEMARAARWERFNLRKGDWIATDPPADIAVAVLGRFGDWPFPSVSGILTTPTLRPDGTILSQAGYDPATRLLLVSPQPTPAIQQWPSRDDALEALGVLLELLTEFPFVDDASRSVALSMLITVVVRGAFDAAPLHASRSPEAGSGKSYLVDLAAAVATGMACPVMAAGRDEAETEKRLGAALLAGQALISIDNVNGELGGDALCQAVERPVVQIRILGRSERVSIETRSTTILATGNNLTLSGDLTRRAITSTLDPRMEQPET